MSTTSFAPVQGYKPDNKIGILPHKKSPREIAREEIRRAQELQKLQEKYEAGEISKFEYTVQKAMLNLPVVIDKATPEPKFATTA